MEFQKFGKIPRLSRDIIITEKIDGTNAQIYIMKGEDYYSDVRNAMDMEFANKYNLIENEDYFMFAGSRTRWLDVSSKGDNFGFAKWVQANAEELLKLGEGRHFGEWYGKGIQRNYGLDEKRFALFNVKKWANHNECLDIEGKRSYPPKCCKVVPILNAGIFDTSTIDSTMGALKHRGSSAVPDFMKPEGIIIYHKASGQLFKKTILNDEKPKGV